MTQENKEGGDGQDKKLPPLSDSERAAAEAGYDDDPQSAEEAKQLASGLSTSELERRANKNEADRTERFRDHFERIATASMYLVWFIVILVGLVWVYHLVAHPCWPRLPDDQVQNMQNLLTGGVLAGLATGHIKRRLT